MKLKSLFEGPSTYMGAGGQRLGAWEEPDDEPDGPPDVSKEIVIPYSLADNTPVRLKVKVTYQQYDTDIQLHTADPIAILLPSGKEMDVETAKQHLGDDNQFDAPEVFDWTAEYLETQTGAKVNYNAPKAPVAAPQKQPSDFSQAPAKQGVVTV